MKKFVAVILLCTLILASVGEVFAKELTALEETDGGVGFCSAFGNSSTKDVACYYLKHGKVLLAIKTIFGLL